MKLFATTAGPRHSRPARHRDRRPQPFIAVLAGFWRTLLLATLLIPLSSIAQAPPSEYQLKAAFIFNFAKFVEWPATALSERAPLVVGVLGDNPFGKNLDQFLRDKTINGRSFAIRECNALEEAKTCQILFISPSEEKRLPEIFKALEGTTVLTVGETARFTEKGGIVNFVSEGNKIRFHINDSSAKQARLKISAKLLSLASSRSPSAGTWPLRARRADTATRTSVSGFMITNCQLCFSAADKNSA